MNGGLWITVYGHIGDREGNPEGVNKNKSPRQIPACCMMTTSISMYSINSSYHIRVVNGKDTV